MKTILKFSVLTALILTLSLSANAQQRANNSEKPRGDRQEQMKKMQADRQQRMMSILDLSAEQRDQVKEVRLNNQKGMLPFRNAMQEKNAKLRTLTTADNYDEEAVKELISEIADLRSAMLTMQIAHRQQIRELLTEEQRIKFDTFRQNSSMRHQRRGIK